MIVLSTLSAVLAGAALAALVAGALWALFTGLSARAGAAALREDGERADALLRAAPAQAAIVRGDGRIELPPRVIDWLGLSAEPRFLTDLGTASGGLTPDDADTLAAAVNAAQRAGKPFRIAVAARGSSRRLAITGIRAPEAVLAPGGVVLWFADQTDSEEAIARLARDSGELHAAFEALAG